VRPQVTPNPIGIGPGGAPEGYMSVFLDVAQPFNFSNYQYWIIFNTSGNKLTPDTQPMNSKWAAYSEGIEVAGNGGSAFARVILFVGIGLALANWISIVTLTLLVSIAFF
jgi:hypothetical protein